MKAELIMSPMTTPCDDSLIERLLSDGLPDEQRVAVESHLESCALCRTRVDELAARPDEWHEVRQQLADTVEAITGSSSFVLASPLRESAAAAAFDIVKHLAPTDDPHMLGRLGGYEIAGVIGAGGMGVVLKGWDRALNRFVAIKVLAPHLAANGTARQRFSREAQAAAAVVHENVVAIHGVSEGSGLPYLVMPYIRGQSLQKRIDERGPLSVVEVLRIGHQIAAGLSAAHQQGLVHRDIKPANILLEDGVERLKITDFGLARASDDASLTQSGTLAGTPQYMSPEQARGEPVDARSDLFSLGSLLYATCTGRPPFRADTSYGILRRITDSAPLRIRELNPQVPDWIEAIIERLLAKQPADRFSSAAEVAEMFQECLAHAQQPTVAPLPEKVAALLRVARVRSRDWRKISVGVLAVAVIGIAVTMFLNPPAPKTNSDGEVTRSVSEGERPADAHSPRSERAPSLTLRVTSPDGDPLAAVPPAAVPLTFDSQPMSSPIAPSYVRSISFSDDDKWLAVGGGHHANVSLATSGSVQIWEVAERKLIRSLPYRGGVTGVSFAPDGRHLAVRASDGFVRVIECETGREVWRSERTSGGLGVRYSPRGTYLAAVNYFGELQLWKAEGFQPQAVTFEGEALPLVGLAFSDDETKLAGCGGTFPPEKTSGVAAVWEVATGRRLVTVKHGAVVFDAAFSSDGRRLATSSLDARANVWDVASGDLVKSLRDPDSGLVGVRFLPQDSGLATLGPSSGIKLWDWKSNTALDQLRFDESNQTAMTLSHDGTLLASGGHDRLVRLWDVASREAVGELNPATASGDSSPIYVLAASLDGKWIAAGREDGKIALRSSPLGESARVFAGHLQPVLALAFTPDGTQLVSASRDNSLRLWSVDTDECLKEIPGPAGGVTALSLTTDGSRILIGSAEGVISTWDMKTQKEVDQWSAHEGSVTALVVSPDGTHLLSVGSDAVGKVWNIENHDQLVTCDAHERAIRAATYSPDGRVIATASDDGRIVLWNAKTGFDRRTLPGARTIVRGLNFSADGKTLVTAGDDRALRVWDVATLTQRQSLTAHTKAVRSLLFSRTAENELISAGLDGAVKLWSPVENAEK